MWIRAAQPQHSLATLERVAGAAHERVLAGLQPSTLATIRSASPLGWIPLELDIELAEVIADVLGPAGGRASAHQAISLSFQSSLLLRFFAGARTIFELEPTSLLARAPLAWRAVYRDAGQLRYAIGHGSQRMLVYSEVPAQVIGNRVYLEAIAGALEAIYDVCGVEGSVTLEAVDPAQRRAELWFSWY